MSSLIKCRTKREQKVACWVYVILNLITIQTEWKDTQLIWSPIQCVCVCDYILTLRMRLYNRPPATQNKQGRFIIFWRQIHVNLAPVISVAWLFIGTFYSFSLCVALWKFHVKIWSLRPPNLERMKANRCRHQLQVISHVNSTYKWDMQMRENTTRTKTFNSTNVQMLICYLNWSYCLLTPAHWAPLTLTVNNF